MRRSRQAYSDMGCLCCREPTGRRNMHVTVQPSQQNCRFWMSTRQTPLRGDSSTIAPGQMGPGGMILSTQLAPQPVAQSRVAFHVADKLMTLFSLAHRANSCGIQEGAAADKQAGGRLQGPSPVQLAAIPECIVWCMWLSQALGRLCVTG